MLVVGRVDEGLESAVSEQGKKNAGEALGRAKLVQGLHAPDTRPPVHIRAVLWPQTVQPQRVRLIEEAVEGCVTCEVAID